MKKLFTLLITLLIFVAINAADKYAQGNITWSTGNWYDAPTGGSIVSAPVSGDNVFTQGYVITVSADATCDNLTFTNAVPSASVNRITIGAGIILTIRGVIDATALADVDVFGLSNATSTLKLTGGAIPTPGSGNVILTTDNAIQSIKPKNIIYAAEDARVYQIQTGIGNYSGINLSNSSTVGSGKMSVKSGTDLVAAKNIVLGQGTENELIVEAGATFTSTTQLRGSYLGTNYHVTKATINGTVVNSGGGFTIYNLVLGSTGILKTNQSNKTNAWELIYDGWWGSVNSTALDVTTGKIATPGIVSFAAGSTIEFYKNGAQNINGTIPTDTLFGYPGTPAIASYTMPYSNLIISGGGNQTKTVQSNLTVTGTLTVAASTILLIPSGITLTIAAGGRITNSGTITNNGTITFQSDATNGTATFTGNAVGGTGTVNVKQLLPYARNYYISSPITAATAPSGYTWYERNEVSSTWTAVSTGASLSAGKGYIALPSAAASTITFTGTLNTGNITIALTKSGSGFNLIGNPYPSNLKWENAFVVDVTNAALIEPSIYVRTNAGTANNNGQWSFQTYNASTGLAVPFHSLLSAGIIPPMQAFWVKAKAAGNLVLDNKLTRMHQASNPLKAPTFKNLDRQLVRLEVSNGAKTDETLLFFDTNALNSFDSFDSPKFANSTPDLELFTSVDNQKLVMNGMNAMPMDTPIGVGFVAGSATSFSMKANEICNMPEGVKVILKDNVTMDETDITDGVASYNFTHKTTTGNRFSLLFRTPGITTDINKTLKFSAQVFVNAANLITIIAAEKCNYAIYNALGQLVNYGTTSSNTTLVNTIRKTGVYIVKLTENGNELTSRVIVK